MAGRGTELAYFYLTQQPLVPFSEFSRIVHFKLLIFIDGTAKNSRQRLDNDN